MDMGARSLFNEYLLFDLENVQYIAWPEVRLDTLTAVRMSLPARTPYMYAYLLTVAFSGEGTHHNIQNPASDNAERRLAQITLG